MEYELKDGQAWIKGLEGRYFVTDGGLVFSIVKGKGEAREMRGGFTSRRFKSGVKDQYKVFTAVYSDGVTKNLYVHKVIAEAFLPNPENKPCVNHKDGVKLNNRLDNLEWVTYSENTRHAYEIGLLKTGARVFLTEEQKDKVVTEPESVYFKFSSDVTAFRDLTAEVFIRNGVPPEAICWTVKKGESFLSTWIKYASIFNLIYAGVGCAEISRLTGIDITQASRMITGNRCKKQREVYEKYQYDDLFMSHKDILTIDNI